MCLATALPPLGPKIRNHRHHEPHCCPVWVGYVLASPLRHLVEDPDEALGRLVNPGDRIIEVGPGMGFTLPLARRVGPSGKAFCVELASGMLTRLQRRVDPARLTDRVTSRQCRTESLALDDLRGSAQGALLLNVLHELSDPPTTVAELHATVVPGSCASGGSSAWTVGVAGVDDRVREASIGERLSADPSEWVLLE